MKALFQLPCGLVFAWTVFICAPGNAFAQGYGTISGRVTDPTGAVVPDTAVMATQAGTGLVLQTTTNGDGTYAANNSGSGQQRDRAVQVGYPYGGSACHAGSICKSYLNPASFTNHPVGTYGTVVKGSFVGPQYADWDVSVARRFSLTERANLQFRAEYFNVLNHTNFGDPNTTNNSTFGQITSTTPQNSVITNDPRIAQLSLKLIF